MKRTPLRRRSPLRSGRKKIKAKNKLARRTKLKPINPARRKKLREQQFGISSGKREWIMVQRCCVTGHDGTPEWPIDPAHVGKTRAAGAGPEMMAPLWRPVHSDFDSLPEAVFEAKYGVSKTWVRQHAELLHQAWLDLPEDSRAWWAERAKEKAA